LWHIKILKNIAWHFKINTRFLLARREILDITANEIRCRNSSCVLYSFSLHKLYYRWVIKIKLLLKFLCKYTYLFELNNYYFLAIKQLHDLTQRVYHFFAWESISNRHSHFMSKMKNNSGFNAEPWGMLI
jgi:hypothetical protein